MQLLTYAGDIMATEVVGTLWPTNEEGNIRSLIHIKIYHFHQAVVCAKY